MKFLFLLVFATGCALLDRTIPELPEQKFDTFTSQRNLDDDFFCIQQTFSVTNEYIGFEEDSKFVSKEKCKNVTGFPLTTWNELDKFLKALYDTHGIDAEVNLSR